MKVFLLLAVLFSAQSAELTMADPMTEQEATTLKKAQDEITAAQAKYRVLASQIMLAHGCKTEIWMEWGATCQIEGKFVTRRYSNYMQGLQIR